MKNKKMSKIITFAALTALVTSYAGPIGNALAAPLNEVTNVTNVAATAETSSQATVSKFSLYSNADLLSAYNAKFKVATDKISVKNNGGKYSSSNLSYIFDGNRNTHWETGKPNTASFKNEVEFTFKDVTTLNRVIYAPRLSGAAGKGYPLAFEIQGAKTDDGKYKVVATGSYSGNVRDAIEIKFNPTEFKKLKFVFQTAREDWAAASEIMFYKEDNVADKMKTLFTNDALTEINAEYNTLDALKQLEGEVKDHPLASEYLNSIDDAKKLIEMGDIESVTAETRKFADYNNAEYTQLFKVDKSNIKSITNNGGRYRNQVITNAIDDNTNTYWETNRGNSTSFNNTVEVAFKEAITIDRLVFGARPNDSKGFAQEFEIYISPTSEGETYQLVSSGKHAKVSGLVEAKFKPTFAKRVKFVFKKSDQNWATLSELAFYKEDTLTNEVLNMFTDGLMNQLKEEYNSTEAINKLAKQVEIHPLSSSLQTYIDLAETALSGDASLIESIITASQRGNANAMASKYQIARTSFSLDTFGKYVVPGETIQLFVDADKNGVMPTLVFGQIADDKNGWHRKYTLQPGLNTITAPAYSNMKPAVIYIENGALPTEQAYAPRVRLVGGTKFPVYYHGVTDPADFEKELEAYVAKISVNDDDFAKGKPSDAVYNVAELVSENNTISTSAAGALKGIQEMKSIGKTVSDTMDEWETMWEEFQKLNGNFKVEKDPTKFFTAKFTSRVFTKGPYGWSDWGYTGYNGGNSARRDGGFFKQIVKPFSVPGNDGWAYYHEWGHNINNSAMEHVEITNNLYSVVMRKVFENSNDDRIDWNSLYKRFSGGSFSHGFWTDLGILEQVLYYYGEDSYGKATQISIKNPDGVMNGLGNNKQRLVIGLSLATETDLTDFFEGWGYVTATDTMKEKVKHLPKPSVKLEYMHSSGRHYKGSGFSEDAKVTVNSITMNEKNNTISLSYSIDATNKEASMGYEIIRNGKVIGYTTSTSFVDKNIDPNENYTYQVVAYDKKLNTSNSVNVKAFKPTISVEEQITLKLRQEYDPLNYVKAVDYKGVDITDAVRVKSNTINITEKGNYHIVYEVTNQGITETKTLNVNVTSNFDYLSDLDATSAKIGWNGLQKDKAPQGGTITLLRDGIDVTYAKGLGAHANSEVVYNVAGKGYDYFESYIGIDQAMKGNNSSATFEVWVDGEKKYSSSILGSSTSSEYIKVPITGANEVKLVTTDAGRNGNTSDHTVWADAKFLISNGVPTLTIPNSVATKVGVPINLNEAYTANDPEEGDLTPTVQVTGADAVNFEKAGDYEISYTVTDNTGNVVTKKRTVSVVDMNDFTYLSDNNWTSMQKSYTDPKKDVAISGNALRLTDEAGQVVTYKKGIGAHSTSTIVYDLTDKEAAYFTSYVGVDRQMYGSVGSVVFQVFVDGVKQYDSGLMIANMAQKYVEVNLAGAKEFKLVVTDGGNGNGSDHATWGDAKLHFANEARVSTAALEEVLQSDQEADTTVAREIQIIDELKETVKQVLAEVQVTDINTVSFNLPETNFSGNDTENRVYAKLKELLQNKYEGRVSILINFAQSDGSKYETVDELLANCLFISYKASADKPTYFTNGDKIETVN